MSINGGPCAISADGRNESCPTTVDSVVHLQNVCPDKIPTTEQLFNNMPVGGWVVIALLVPCVIITLAIYVDEVLFLVRNFQPGPRREKTIWILAFFPVYSVCGFMAVVVPRSGTLVDFVANVFFSYCLYNFGYLMMNYIGGEQRMWRLVGDERSVAMNTVPCCCCCFCLPSAKFTRRFYRVVSKSIIQVAVIRPIIMFIAAVLWTNNSYIPGNISAVNAYVYISAINLISTLAAIYGLTLLRGALTPELEQRFKVTGKILSLQLTLLISSIPNVIIQILVATDVIKCGPFISSKARGEVITAICLTISMLPFSLVGRLFYRRASDGSGLGGDDSQEPINAATSVYPQTTNGAELKALQA